jgi:hypothetical protein
MGKIKKKFRWRRFPKLSVLPYKSPVVCWHSTKKSVLLVDEEEYRDIIIPKDKKND